MTPPDLSDALYAALTAASFASQLSIYKGAPAVFTSRPIPADSLNPCIVSAGDVVVSDDDFIYGPLFVIVRDIAIYGAQKTDNRTVESLGRSVYGLFHRQNFSLSVAGFRNVDIRCSGPIKGPTDDDTTIARIVTLRIRLTPSS